MTVPTGTWRLVLLGGRSPGGGTHGPVTLTFDGDGMLYGMAGVNRVRATWATDEDDQLTIGPLVSTMMAGPPEAMATERALLVSPHHCCWRMSLSRTAPTKRTRVS